jgi:hypothetical protein
LARLLAFIINLLLLDQDYEFTADSSVRFLIALNKGDVIVIDDYTDTTGLVNVTGTNPVNPTIS